MQQDMNSAVGQLEPIGDPKQRTQSQQMLAHRWLRQDPTAARAWIQRSDLPAEMKNQLLQINPGG